MKSRGYSLLYLAVLATSTFSHPESSVDRTQHVHYGTIKENAVEGDEVELDKPLVVKNEHKNTGDICGYTLYKSTTDLPFRVVVTDSRTGAAKILVTRGAQLDYESIKEYNFELAPQNCITGEHSERERVHIEVENVNEFSPTWPKTDYTVDVTEGNQLLAQPLLQLHAVDRDGTGKICRYILLTHDVPFSVDNEGKLRVTGQLDYNKKKSYNLEVVAEDCGGLRSDTARVHINVKPVCQAGWTGISDRIEFSPHDSRRPLMPRAELETCDTKACNITHVSVTLKLSTEHIGKGCDRDTYSLHSQRKLCGAAEGSLDLLPSPTSISTLAKHSWTKSIPTDDGKESDQIFALDGRSTAIEIPIETLNPRLGPQFTFSTWMKHDHQEEHGKTGQTAKEQIICHSDGDEMNRHHYSLFLHNCKLILLLRQEGDDLTVDPNVFYPAEWRWKLPEVCDSKWHHYVISVDFPEVRLYVDGRRFVESKHNPEIVDDWPLRSTKHVHFTKLVVGACWMGGKQRMGQFFKGYLAGVSILQNKTESDSVISCLNNCQEKLDFDGIEDMDTGMSVSMNNEMTSITISGMTLGSVERLLRRVGYVNTRNFPTPGHRPVSIETHATCEDGSPLAVSPLKTLIMVLEAEKPEISVAALELVHADVHKVTRGEKIFRNLHISAHTSAELSELKSSSEHSSESKEAEKDSKSIEDETNRLDSCLVTVSPPLNLHVEHLKYPENLISLLGLQVDTSEDGLVVAGADKLKNYEEVLSEIQYVNSHPEDVNYRSFVLTCTELNGRFVSNQAKVKMELIHEKAAEVVSSTVAPPAIRVDKAHAPQQQSLNAHLNGLHAELTRNSDSQTITGIVVVCVVCVGFIALIVVLGVIRIRNTRRHEGGRHGGRGGDLGGPEALGAAEMEWDHSSLTITVNPMDQEGVYGGVTDRLTRAADDSEEEEDSYHDNVNSDEEEEEEEEEIEVERAPAAVNSTVAKNKELEWDDSTLTY